MHAVFAHAYHLARFGLHVLLLCRAPLAALAVAGVGRAAGLARSPRGAAVVASVAVLAGWLLLDPHWSAWPPPPIARMPGLALILLAEAGLRAGMRPRLAWPITAVTAALAAWWLRGAPDDAGAILWCLPVFVGLVAGLNVARSLSGQGGKWASLAAALLLAATLMMTGAAPHWARAATVPGMGALALLGVAGAGQAVAAAVVMTAAATIVASDRGRLAGVDAACAVPLLIWLVAAWAARRRLTPGPQATITC